MSYTKLGKSKCNLYFGVELEVECIDSKADRDDIEEACEKKWGKYFYDIGEDGSLDDGIEFRLKPMTYRTLCTRSWLDKWLKFLDKQNIKSWDTSTCGLHVHIDRSAFTAAHGRRFWRFFYANPNFISRVARRKAGSLRQWANPREYKPGDWDKAIGDSKDGWPDPDNRGWSNVALKYIGEKYVSCSIHDEINTFEVRIFRGTLSASAFRANIQFLHALYYFTKHHADKTCTLGNFLLWLREHKTRYSGALRLCTIRHKKLA